MKRTILRTLLTTSVLGSLSLTASAATVANPAGTNTATSGAAGSGLIAVALNNGTGSDGVNQGGATSSTNGWTGTADGALYAAVGVPLTSVVATSVDSQSYTRLGSNGSVTDPFAGVAFGLSTTIGGTVGDLVTATGLLQANAANLAPIMNWSTTTDSMALSAGGQYSFSFDFRDMTGLLTGADPGVLDNLSIIIIDGDVERPAFNSNNGLLGLTNLVDNQGRLSVNFTTTTGDVKIKIVADSLLSSTTNLPIVQDLLDNTGSTDLYRLSGFDVSPVPEPSAALLGGLGLLFLLRRRRA